MINEMFQWTIIIVNKHSTLNILYTDKTAIMSHLWEYIED